MPQDQPTINANAAAQKKVTAATVALQHIKARNPALAQKIVSDWVAAGFALSSAVKADLSLASAISSKDAGAVRAMMADKDAAALAARQGLSANLTGVGNAIAQNAAGVAGTIPKVGNAVVNGLHNTFDVSSFLGALANGNTWLRVAEVALGIVLVVVGMVKLAPPSVTGNVKSIAKVAALL